MRQHPFEQLLAIPAIDPDVAQFLATARQALKHQLRPIAILNGGCGHNDDQEMAVTAFDLFATIEAAFATDSGRFHTLTVQATGRGVFMFACFLPYFGTQGVVNLLLGAIIAPLPKVMVHAFPVRILFRQHPPLDPDHHNIQNCIDDQAHLKAAWSSARFRRWNLVLDIMPLAVS